MKLLENRHFWQFILAAMLVALAFAAFWPNPVDQPIRGQLDDVLGFLYRHGVPRWLGYRFVEAIANVSLFLPFGFVGALAFRAKQWWQIGAFGLLISCCIELGQLLFLHNRFASPVDLMTNTSGAMIGALATRIIVKRLKARSPSATDLQ